jgi:hypothetical protein
MRIVGESRDYYDSARAFGQDANCVFVRSAFAKAEHVPAAECGIVPVEFGALRVGDLERRRWQYSDRISNRRGEFGFSPFVIWFAGVRHAGIRIAERRAAPGFSETVHSTAWSASALREFLVTAEAELLDSGWSLDRDLNSDNIDAWFADKGDERQRNWLAAKGVSIAVSHDLNGSAHGHRWREGRGWKFDVDGLGNLGFAKVLPPYEAFQELSMWVGGVLPNPGSPTVEIGSDVVRAEKHGFDGWSFRRKPAPR